MPVICSLLQTQPLVASDVLFAANSTACCQVFASCCKLNCFWPVMCSLLQTKPLVASDVLVAANPTASCQFSLLIDSVLVVGWNSNCLLPVHASFATPRGDGWCYAIDLAVVHVLGYEGTSVETKQWNLCSRPELRLRCKVIADSRVMMSTIVCLGKVNQVEAF